MEIKNYICPICNVRFTEDDDVVVCPECGTPHHRECYNKENNCFNSHLHGNGEDLKSTFTVGEKEKVKDEEISFSMPNEKKSDSEGTFPMPEIFKNLTEQINSSPASTSLIDGKPGIYYEIAVKSNQNYYIPRFTAIDRGERKSFLNAVAFFMPLAWSVYRKMYKFAAIILAVYMIFFGINFYNIQSNLQLTEITQICMEEDMYFLQNILEYQSTGEGKLTENQQEFIKVLVENQLPPAVSYGYFIIICIIRFVMGLKANNFYMKKIKKTIEQGESKGLDKEALKAFVYRKNGTMLIILPAIIAMYEIGNYLL